MDDEASAGARPAVDERRGGPSLREALRLARIEAAERSDVVIDLRQAELARLEILRDALAPVFADVPPEIDLFDVGLVPGERPRLFVDMVAFIEMGRDRKVYRFLRDGRHGRTVAAESEQTGPIVEAVTAYVARRLIERERLLVDDESFERPPAAPAPPEAAPATPPVNGAEKDGSAAPARAENFAMTTANRPPRRWLRLLAIASAFVVGGGVGAAVVVGLMVAAAKGLLPGVGGA
jgi:hypothetical protein